jgi:hypothetical protein
MDDSGDNEPQGQGRHRTSENQPPTGKTRRGAIGGDYYNIVEHHTHVKQPGRGHSTHEIRYRTISELFEENVDLGPEKTFPKSRTMSHDKVTWCVGVDVGRFGGAK